MKPSLGDTMTRRRFLRHGTTMTASITLLDLVPTIRAANRDGGTDGDNCSTYLSGDSTCTKKFDDDEACDTQPNKPSHDRDQGCYPGDGANSPHNADGGCQGGKAVEIDIDQACQPDAQRGFSGQADNSCQPYNGYNDTKFEEDNHCAEGAPGSDPDDDGDNTPPGAPNAPFP